MSGRHEIEMVFDNRTNSKLQDLPPVMSDYYYSLMSSGKSYTTAYRYINHVVSFLEFTFNGYYDDDFYLNITSAHINKYIASLRTKEENGVISKTSDSFRGVSWSALNSFFQFLVPNYIKVNPVESTNRPKIKDNPGVTYLTDVEITNVLSNVEKKSQTKFKNRDLCILKLGFSTGLRVSAIVQIDINDIDFVNNKIKVTEKGDYDNFIMFGANLKKQLLTWIEERKKYFNSSDTDALFVNQYGQRIGTEAVRRMIKKYTNGITDKKVTPHVMRHSCATNLYEKTGDIYLCARQLNHKNVTTTQRYAEISSKKQREAADTLDSLI